MILEHMREADTVLAKIPELMWIKEQVFWKTILELSVETYHMREADTVLAKIPELMWLKEQVFNKVGMGE